MLSSYPSPTLRPTTLPARRPAGICRSLTLPLLLALAPFSRGQSAPPAAGSGAEDVIKLEPFKVVTDDGGTGYGAQSSSSSSRLNLRYIDVPQTVNVVTAEFLADAFIFDSREFTKYVNGVTPRTNTHQEETFFIRGLQTTTSYVEGFLTTIAVNRDSALYNRTEYVKGPASAAIGRGEAGGLVNFVQKKPLGRKHLSTRFTVGTDNFKRGEIDLDGVILPGGKLSFRLPIYYEDGDGPRGGSLLHTEKHGIGPALTWRPFSRTELNLTSAIFHHSTPGAVASAHWMDQDLVDMRVDQNGINKAVWYPGPNTPLVPRENVYTYAPNFRKVDVKEFNLIATHKFNDALSLRQGFRAEWVDGDVRRFNSPPAIARSTAFPSGYFVTLQYVRNHIEDEGIRSQTDLLYQGAFLGGRHTILSGFDVFDKSGVRQSGTRTGLQMDLYRPDTRTPATFDPDTYIAVNAGTDQDIAGDGYGTYAQYSGAFLKDKIQVMAGWRKDRTTAEVYNRRNRTTTREEATTDVPRFSVGYKPRDWATIYYLHSLQADPAIIRNRYGGPIPLGGASVPADWRQNELLSSQVKGVLDEVGVKVSLLEGKLTGALSHYKMRRDGFIQNEVKAEPGPGGIGTIQFTENYVADGEKVDGYELELFGRPLRQLTLYAGLVIQDGTNPRANGVIQPVDTLTDEVTFHGKYSLRDAQRNGFEFTGGGKMWKGGWTISNGSFVKFHKDQYSLDAGAAYYWRGGRYALRARVNNILDDFIIITENSQWSLRRMFLSFSADF